MKILINHYSLCFLIFCFYPMSCIGANNQVTVNSPILTVDDLIDVALSNNPQLLVAKSIMDGEEGILTQTRSQYLPHVKYDGDVGRQHVEDDTLDDDVDNVIHNGISATQLLLDFGNTTGAISASKSRLESARADYQQIGTDIVLRTKSLYYRYWKTLLLISVAAEQVENYKSHLYRAEELYNTGIRTQIDVTNAKVELSSSELTLRKRQYDKQIALLELEKELGKKPNNGDYTVYLNEDGIEKLTDSLPPLPPSLDTLLEKASRQRSDLQSAKISVSAANADVKSVKGRYWPSLSAIASANQYDTDLVELRNNWQLGVGLNWDLFSGFQTQGEMAEAKSAVRRRKSELRNVELNTTLEVTSSFVRADEKRGNVMLANNIVALSRENLRLADERYLAGLGDMIEFNDAQLRLSKSLNSLVIAYVDYLTSLARVEKAIGVTPVLPGIE